MSIDPDSMRAFLNYLRSRGFDIGVDDFVADGNVSYTIVTAPAVSADLTYLALNPADVAAGESGADNDHERTD